MKSKPRPGGSVTPELLAVVNRAPQIASQLADIGAAEDALSARCMTSQGMRFPWSRKADRPLPPFFHGRGIFFIPLTLQFATVHGLGVGDSLRVKAGLPASPIDRYLGTLTPAQLARWNHAYSRGPAVPGITFAGHAQTFDSGGCLAKAVGQLYGGLWNASFANTFNVIWLVDADRFNIASRMVAPARPWARCMRARGYRTRTMADVYNQIFDRYQASGITKAATAFERTEAVAASVCERSTGVIAADLSAERRAFAALPMSQLRILDHAVVVDEAAISRAHIVLGETGHS